MATNRTRTGALGPARSWPTEGRFQLPATPPLAAPANGHRPPGRTAEAQAYLLASGALLAIGLVVRRWGAHHGAAAARQAQDAALAQLAHDLKTPLTALKGHAQLLQRLTTADPDAAKLRAGLAAIDVAATAAAARLDRLEAETCPAPPPDR